MLEGLEGVSQKDYEKSLCVEIRATYFQAIETLFELMFSLEPRSGIIDNENVWYYLSISKGPANYKTIAEIANGETKFLDRIVNASKSIKVPFVQYLFYFAVTDESALTAIRASFEPIRRILIALAQDFVDREEYNAFKHGLRLVGMQQQSFQLIDRATGKVVLKKDLSNSLTYLKLEPDGSITLRTKVLDTERDIRMTTLCTKLIANLIRGRALHFNKGSMKEFTTFTDEALGSADERSNDWVDFKINFTADSDN
jgi:hypothetical protein